MEHLITTAVSFEQTRDARTLLGKRVLAKNGMVVGRVSQIRLDANQTTVVGIVVRRNVFRRIYICIEYVSRFTAKAVFLSIDPFILFRNRAMFSSDGKRFGRVIDVLREQETNTITSLIVRRRIFWKLEVPISEVNRMNKVIFLHKKYDEAKKFFT